MRSGDDVGISEPGQWGLAKPNRSTYADVDLGFGREDGFRYCLHYTFSQCSFAKHNDRKLGAPSMEANLTIPHLPW